MDEVISNGVESLRRMLERTAAEVGCTMTDLTVLSSSRDPYRLDTPAGHRDGAWFAEQVQRFIGSYKVVHLRGLHYRISASGDVHVPNGKPYINTDDCWDWLENKAAKAGRWLGYVPFDRIVDERNAPAEIYVPEAGGRPLVIFSSGLSIDVPEWAGSAYPRLFSPSFPERQPYRIVFFGEKTSLRDVLLPFAQRVGGELLLPTGEASDTMVAELIKRAAADGRPVVVLYFSDFDPSGRQMAISVSRKLQALKDLKYPDLDLRLYSVALTLEQVRDLRLPSTPLKETERRADKWREAFGHEQTEIDAAIALEPAALRLIVEQAVSPFFDFTLHRRATEAHTQWSREADERLHSHPAYGQALTVIDAALQTVRQAVESFHATQETARARLESEVNPPPIVVPEAHTDTEPPPALFSTSEDYVTATRRLVAHKNLHFPH